MEKKKAPLFIEDITNNPTNKQKNELLVDWIVSVLENESTTVLLERIEENINSLPQGTHYFKSTCPKTGKEKIYSINYRDVAKRSFINAWRNARVNPILSIFERLDLKFKLSAPVLFEQEENERIFRDLRILFDQKPSFERARTLWLHCQKFKLSVPSDVLEVFVIGIEKQEFQRKWGSNLYP